MTTTRQPNGGPARKAIVCNLQNENYSPNALLLGYTIRKHHPNLTQDATDTILLIPHEHDITPKTLSRLEEVGWKIRKGAEVIVPGMENLQSNYQRNFMKLRIWSWIEYSKIAVVDADCLCMGDISLLLSNKFGIFHAFEFCIT